MRRNAKIGLLLILCFAFAGMARAEEVRLSLDSCMALAKRNNPVLRKSEYDVKRAEEVKAQALTKYFPQIQGTAFGYHSLHPVVDIGIDDINNAAVRDLLTTLYGNYGAALGLDNSLNLFRHGYMVGVTALQPVFVGGKIVAGNKLAKVGVEAAKLQAQVSQRDVLESVEESYWLVYSLQQKEQIIDEALELLDSLSAAVSSAVDAGLALPYDRMQVELHRDEILRRQVQLQNGLRLAQRALALAIGAEDELAIVTMDQETEIGVLPVNDTLAQTAEQQLLDLQVQAAQLRKRMALADALPQIAVGANYSYSRYQANILRNGLGNNTGNGALFVTLNVPLTQWWETSHKLREKQYEIEQAKIDAQYLGSQLNMRTRQAYDEVVNAMALLRIHERTAAHAQQAYLHAKANYEAGLATVTDLLQSQTALTQAQDEWTDARIAYRVHLRRYQDLISTTVQ